MTAMVLNTDYDPVLDARFAIFRADLCHSFIFPRVDMIDLSDHDVLVLAPSIQMFAHKPQERRIWKKEAGERLNALAKHLCRTIAALSPSHNERHLYASTMQIRGIALELLRAMGLIAQP